MEISRADVLPKSLLVTMAATPLGTVFLNIATSCRNFDQNSSSDFTTSASNCT